VLVATDSAGRTKISSPLTITTLAPAITNQLQIIATEPDSNGITNIGICFTNPSALSGTVIFNLSGVSSGSFLKHSGTPACPSFVSGSSGLRLTPNTTYNYSATASNNGINYSATLTHRTPTPTPTPTPLVPALSLSAQSASSVCAFVSNWNSSVDAWGAWSVSVSAGSAIVSRGDLNGTGSGLTACAKGLSQRQSVTITVTSSRTGSISASASINGSSQTTYESSAPTQYSGTDAYSGIVSPGRQQSWELGFQNAVSVSVVATSPGEASIVAPFSPNPGQNLVAAVADGLLPGQKLYKVIIAVPTNAPRNKLFTLTWTATAPSGQTLVVSGGSFNTGP
jgi:hypothetical protein